MVSDAGVRGDRRQGVHRLAQAAAALLEAKQPRARRPSCARTSSMSPAPSAKPRAVRRGTAAVDDVMSDVPDAMGTVKFSRVVASVVTAPQARLRSAYGEVFRCGENVAPRDVENGSLGL